MFVVFEQNMYNAVQYKFICKFVPNIPFTTVAKQVIMSFKSKLSLVNRFFVYLGNGSIKNSGDKWILLKYTSRLVIILINLFMVYKTHKWVTYLMYCNILSNKYEFIILNQIR